MTFANGVWGPFRRPSWLARFLRRLSWLVGGA
jgi:hypothetical protein